jgi:hypothetical protein
MTTTTPGQTIGAAGTGTTRRSATTGYLVWTEENPAGGLVDYKNEALTQGLGLNMLLPGQDRSILRPGKPTYGYLPSSRWMLGPRTERNHLRWKNYSVFVEQTVGKLAMEVAWNAEILDMNYDRDRPNQYRVDLSPTNPDGSTNRHFLDAYADVVPRQALIGAYGFTTRASVAYPFDFGWMSQQVIVMGNKGNGNGYTRHERMVRLNNSALRNYQQGANFVQTRRYWSTGGDTPHTEALSSNGIKLGRVTSHSQGDKSDSKSLQAAMVGSYFKRKVSTILGWRTDSITTDTANVFFTSNDWETRGVNAATDYRPLLKGETTPALLDPLGRAEKVWSSQRMDTLVGTQPYDPVKNPRYSEIFPLSRRVSTFTAGGVWYPIKSLGVFVNQSTGFTFSGNNYKLDFSPAPPPEKVGIDYGLKVELFDGRLSGTISTYKSRENGYGASIAGGSPPSQIWNQAYSSLPRLSGGGDGGDRKRQSNSRRDLQPKGGRGLDQLQQHPSDQYRHRHPRHRTKRLRTRSHGAAHAELELDVQCRDSQGDDHQPAPGLQGVCGEKHADLSFLRRSGQRTFDRPHHDHQYQYHQLQRRVGAGRRWLHPGPGDEIYRQ